jgi:glycosyltransferase involved in cell wall biosynthesis
MLLSIIIPAYNVDRYIETAILSIISQMEDGIHNNIEIVVTNDGSTDNTGHILDRLRLEYTNLYVIHQDNLGVSVARNNAIHKSIGKFIIFLDADDSLAEGTLKKVLFFLERTTNLDMVVFGYRKVELSGNVTYETDFQEVAKKNFDNLLNYYAISGENNHLSDANRCWGIAFLSKKVKIINKPFPEGVAYLEDGVFLAKFFLVMSNYSLLNIHLCNRLIRPGSAVNSDLLATEKAVIGFKIALRDLNHFFTNFGNGLNLSSDRLSHYNQSIIKFSLLRIISVINTKSSFGIFNLMMVINKEKQAFDCTGVRYPYNIMGRVYQFSPILFVVFFTLLSIFRSIRSKVTRTFTCIFTKSYLKTH